MLSVGKVCATQEYVAADTLSPKRKANFLTGMDAAEYRNLCISLHTQIGLFHLSGNELSWAYSPPTWRSYCCTSQSSDSIRRSDEKAAAVVLLGSRIAADRSSSRRPEQR